MLATIERNSSSDKAERLLAEDMLPCRQRGQNLFRMQMMPSRDDDCIDVRDRE